MITRQMNQKSQTLSIASWQDMIAESDTESKRERVYASMRFFRGEQPMQLKQTEIAQTLLASKSKFSNLGEDIVIEKRTNSNNGL